MVPHPKAHFHPDAQPKTHVTSPDVRAVARARWYPSFSLFLIDLFSKQKWRAEEVCTLKGTESSVRLLPRSILLRISEAIYDVVGNPGSHLFETTPARFPQTFKLKSSSLEKHFVSACTQLLPQFQTYRDRGCTLHLLHFSMSHLQIETRGRGKSPFLVTSTIRWRGI